MKKFTYEVAKKGNYNDFLKAYNKLGIIDETILFKTEFWQGNFTAITLASIDEVACHIDVNNEILCYVYDYSNHTLYIMLNDVFDSVLYSLCDNAYQFYRYSQLDGLDNLLISSNKVDSFKWVKGNDLLEAYKVGSKVDNALIDLYHYNKLAGFSLDEIALHNNDIDSNTRELFEQVTIMLENVIAKGSLL